MRRAGRAAAVILAAAAVVTLVSLPPGSLALAPPGDDSIPGVIHIHTNRSDGRSSPDDVAAAAARAGLKFLVFTDHGDGTRLEPPAYRHGVLCIDGVEISTSGGHYIAIDMPPAPYPLGGEARDVVEDVRRLGGFGYAAHPDSPKADLRWSDWSLAMDGMELVNPDTSWRVRALEPGLTAKLRFLDHLLTYPFRPAGTIASLLTDSSENIARWDSFTSRTRFVGLAGADAHGRLALWNTDAGDHRSALPFPGYEASFRTETVHLRLGASLSGNAHDDAALVMQAVRRGHLYIAVNAFATPPSLQFSAETSSGVAEEGDEIAAGLPVTLRVNTNAPSTFSTIVWSGSSVLSSNRQSGLTLRVPGTPATYRVEMRATDRRGQPAWLLSNPIYVRAAGMGKARAEPTRGAGRDVFVLFDGSVPGVPGVNDGWRAESSPAASAQLEAAADPQRPAQRAVKLRYALSGADTATAAMLMQTPAPITGSDRLTFRARADRPMRLSVQLRTFGDGAAPEERWQRSVYLDTADRDVTVFFDEMTAVGSTRTPKPALSGIRHVLFVVDTTNTKPGGAGEVWIARAALQR